VPLTLAAVGTSGAIHCDTRGHPSLPARPRVWSSNAFFDSVFPNRPEQTVRKIDHVSGYPLQVLQQWTVMAVRLRQGCTAYREFFMAPLLGLSRLIDTFNEFIGKFVRWLVLAAVLISAGNAIVRKMFNVSSNGLLEIQWYLFAGVFMLGAGFAFLRNVHVRIDFISNKLSKRTNTIIDVLGILLFLMPLCLILIKLSWPFFTNAWATGEMSSNAGGLIRWPVLVLIPLGFAILLLQAVSELIKRVAFLMGVIDEPMSVEAHKSDEELLAEELALEAEKKLAGAR
jgi:TRAP-type mannitol/chloroaromatic compound transport system permease small subunit